MLRRMSSMPGRGHTGSRRAFVVVIDALGAGALPDAERYGDAGANTLAHLAEEIGGLQLPVLQHLGLGSILPLVGVAPAPHPVLHGRLHALGPGKDSAAGHAELMGIVAVAPPPTYPDGFPPEVLDLVRAASGCDVICNRPYNGLAAIEHFGAEHLRTGAVIVYTSQDSVLQIAAHERLVPVDRLHALCQAVRERLPSEHAVGRVIARPFTGSPGKFRRLPGRRDFSLPPPGRSYLEELQGAGVPVHAVGKAGELFCGVGVDKQHPGASNAEAIRSVAELIAELGHGLVFTNLIETDQVYGHRHDAVGFGRALQGIDAAVGEWLEALGEQDLLVLCADHGCDVTAAHTDHTREHVPLLARFAAAEGRHDGPMADVGASALWWLAGRRAELPGTPFPGLSAAWTEPVRA